MKKITKVSERPLDGRTPHMSISHKTYQKGLKNLRKQAKKEHKKLLTNNGVEDYVHLSLSPYWRNLNDQDRKKLLEIDKKVSKFYVDLYEEFFKLKEQK